MSWIHQSVILLYSESDLDCAVEKNSTIILLLFYDLQPKIKDLLSIL